MLLQVLVGYSFLLVSSIPLYGCTTFCFSIYSWIDGHLRYFQYWLLWTMLLWMFFWVSLREHIPTVMLNLCIPLKLLGHGVCVHASSGGTPWQFFKWPSLVIITIFWGGWYEALHLLGRCSTSWTMPPTLFALAILDIGLTFCLSQPGPHAC
jgi:hypothetical protein